jgi:hypothetical protein
LSPHIFLDLLGGDALTMAEDIWSLHPGKQELAEVEPRATAKAEDAVGQCRAATVGGASCRASCNRSAPSVK